MTWLLGVIAGMFCPGHYTVRLSDNIWCEGNQDVPS